MTETSRLTTWEQPMRTVRIVVATLLIAVVAGCGDANPATSPSATAQNVTPTTSPTAQPSTTTGTALLEFSRQGGIAGMDDRLVVQPDGSYTITRRGGSAKAGKLSAAELAVLRQQLDAANLGALPSVTRTGTIADGFTYRLVYQGREVVAADGSVPPPLEPLIGALNQLLAR
jgi:hypothetical protein